VMATNLVHVMCRNILTVVRLTDEGPMLASTAFYCLLAWWLGLSIQYMIC
jgi:hypothetical protein